MPLDQVALIFDKKRTTVTLLSGYQNVRQSRGLKAAVVNLPAATSSLSSWVTRKTAVHKQTHLLGQFLDAGAAFGQIQKHAMGLAFL